MKIIPRPIACLSLLASVILAGGNQDSVGPSVTIPNPADVPVLVSARQEHIHVRLVWTHPTASHFQIRNVHQDAGISQSTESILGHPECKKIGPGEWECDKAKLISDTNSFSIAVVGMTNWSQSIVVIP